MRSGRFCQGNGRVGSLLLAAFVSSAGRGDVGSSPGQMIGPPERAIGFGSRAKEFDPWPGFRTTPPGYGEVGFYWWVGDPLSRERLEWQLDRLKGKGVMGLQINYAHSDVGGRSYGLTYASEPPLFSEAWWSLVGWFVGAARERGMAVSLSDYTLGVGQGWKVDQALAAHPEIRGAELRHEVREVRGGAALHWELPARPLTMKAYPWQNGRLSGEAVDLQPQAADRTFEWTAPAGVVWKVIAVWAERNPFSVDPMHPASGAAIIEAFFQPFADRCPGEAGRGLNFFFSDELDFGVHGKLWNDRFAEEFRRRKGYDLIPDLPALFEDLDERTPKVRMDYGDVMVQLSEENYFQPVWRWHQERGMIYGCDHGGRGRDVVEFGDYFRTQRWNQGPGSDQPGLARDLIKAKVAASMAHLYERPRVWLEGFYGSGWGTSTAQLTEATVVNFLHGYNLLTLHGLYYSTRGGWWEWAPPCNHWRMPYWEHMGTFMDGVQRLSFLLSQGDHVCDVAVMYPVAPVEAGMDGARAVEVAFAAGEKLYGAGHDFDFIDFQSLERADLSAGRIDVAGESYRVLVLPAMRAVRHSTLQQALAFRDRGGLVVALERIPEATDRRGRFDPEVAALNQQLFGFTAEDRPPVGGTRRSGPNGRGLSLFVPDAARLGDVMAAEVAPDVVWSGARATAHQHRRIGRSEVYAFYGASRGAEARFRATGRVELWDAWQGTKRAVPVIDQNETHTRLRLPLETNELQLIVFSPGVAEHGDPLPPPAKLIPVAGAWNCIPEPTMDNRWGDFRIPATTGRIGVEASRFRYREATGGEAGWERTDFDDATWERVTCGFGGKFLQLGPVAAASEPANLEANLAARLEIRPLAPEPLAGVDRRWRRYDFSWRWGVEGDRGHQGYHGLKERLYDEFIRFGRLEGEKWMPRMTRQPEAAGATYYLWTTVRASRAMDAVVLAGGLRPSAIWVNGQSTSPVSSHVAVHAGSNPVLLRYNSAGTGYFALAEPDSPVVRQEQEVIAGRVPRETVGSLAMRWHGLAGILPFDVRPGEDAPVGWYRFTSPPGMKALALQAEGPVRCWVDGVEIEGQRRPGEATWRFTPESTVARGGMVALRVVQARGVYGGETIPNPIRFECGVGEIEPGDWSGLSGLETYSGGLRYLRTLSVPERSEHERVVLDLGDVVSSAEVRVNGQSVGTRVAPPWRYDLTAQVRTGSNRVEVLVYNTLGNHYLTIPTGYRGSVRSGMIGPVTMRFEAASAGR